MEAAADKQANDIVLLDMRELCSFAEYFVICSGETRRQAQAICDAVDRSLGGEGIQPLHREGDAESGWVLLDYGDVIIHIFDAALRDYYRLEKLWGKATPLVSIE